MNRLLPLLLLAALMLQTGNARAQTDEHRIQSVFIYNFTKYFNWKKDADPEFVIGVLGGPALKAELDKRFEAKPTVDGKPVVVREFKSVEGLTKCHMLVVPSLQSGKFDEVLARLEGTNTLLITCKEGLGKKGSGVNFTKVDGKLRFELNKAALQKNNILASSEIERLSIIL